MMDISLNSTYFYCPAGFQQPVVVTVAELDDQTASYLIVGGGASEYRLHKEPRRMFEAHVTYGTALSQAFVERLAVKTPADAKLYGRMVSILQDRRPITQAQEERLGYYVTSKDTRERFEGLIAFAYADPMGDWLYEIKAGQMSATLPRSKFTVPNGPLPGDPPPPQQQPALTVEESAVRRGLLDYLVTVTSDRERIKAWERDHAETLDAISRALAGGGLSVTPPSQAAPSAPASPEPSQEPHYPAPAVPPYTSTYKGHPMLVLTLDDTGREFKFGRTKAQSILQNLGAIREFAAGSDDAPDEDDGAADGSPKA